MTTYYNFSGAAMATSAADKAFLHTTVYGQTLTAAANTTTQLSDSSSGVSYGGATLYGNNVDCSFYIADSSDQIIVTATNVVDTVFSWAAYTLPANVNNLTLEAANLIGTGNSGNDLMIALATGDTLIAGSGQDVMVDNGTGGEIFQFGLNATHDVIYGFQTGGAAADVIQLPFSSFTNFAAVQSHLSQVGSDVLFTISSTQQVLIHNTLVASLTASNFALSTSLANIAPSFDDEFNSLSLYNSATGTGTWKTNFESGSQTGVNSWTSRTLQPNAEQEIYVDPNWGGSGTTPLGLNPFSISNGVLSITAALTPVQDLTLLHNYKYTSGLLTTAKSFTQTYGYFEVRAELPSGPGDWPAFWLLPTDGTWPPEADVMEQIGGKQIYESAHFLDANGAIAQTAVSSYLPTNSTGFHTYGLLWTATSLSWYTDGVEIATTATPSDMNKPMYMLVNLAIGGTWPGSPPSNFTTAQMQVDYVKAYSLASLNLPSTVAPSLITTGPVAPTWVPSPYSTKVNAPLTVSAAQGVLASDVDHNGLAMTAALTANGGPSHGTLVFHADGSFSYTPTPGYAGTDSFTYIASDSLSSSAPITVALTVATAPTTAPAAYAAKAGSAAVIATSQGVLTKDTDNNGLTLKAALAPSGGPQHGTLALNTSGAFTYTPTLGYAGTDSFTYIASDNLSSSAPVTVTLTVTATAPTTAVAAYAANAGSAFSATAAQGVLSKDADHNGLGLTAALTQNGGPQHGTLVLNADGSFTYTPTLGFTGTDSFTYVASDSLSSGTPTTVTLNVAATAPTTQAASYPDNAGRAASADAAHGVLANAIDNNGLGLTATLAQNGGPQHGTLVLNADGSFTYTPTLDFAGTDSFTYIASDSLSSGAPTTVTLNVAATAPTTQAASYADNAGQAASADSAHGVLANAIDNNGLGLTATLTQNGGPQHGTLVLNADGSFTYTPSLGFAGTDSFTYVASDSLSSSGPVTVTLNVAATAPTTHAASYADNAGQAASTDAAHGVLATAIDNNGLGLTATLAQNGGPQHGTLNLNADGSFTYTPVLGFAGTDSFTYVASDSLSFSQPITVTLNIAATAPTTQAASYADNAGQAASADAAYGVLANAIDNNGLGLTATLAQNGGPQHGTLNLNADGSFIYTPTLGYAGTDSFTYVASDSLSSSGPVTVTLNIAATAPTTQAASYADNAGQAASADAAHGVLANAVDNNGLGLTAVLAQNGGPQHGDLILNADGSFTYTPALGFAGTDSFTYVASDSLSTGIPTTVTLNVTATAPATQATSYADNAGQAASADAAHGVLANAIDNNGLSLTATLAQNGGPQHGNLILNADGSFTYTPTLGFAGTDSFTYVASDSLSSSGPVTVTLNVAATAPTTQAVNYADNAGQAASVDAAHGVLANAIDNNGLGLTATLAQNGGPQHGDLILNADGSFTYTPTLGFAGTDSFTYIASDSLSTGIPTTVTLNVTATAPATQAASYADNAGQAASADAAHGVLAYAVDNNGLGLTATLAQNGGPQHGTLVLNADGSFTYTPTLGFADTDSFTYVASDSLSSGTPTTVTLNVAATAPTTQAASYADNAGQAASADAAHGVLANAVDNNGLGLTAVLAQNGGPQHGDLILNADGSFTYTPALGFAGTDSFTYVASDSLSSSGPVTVTFNISATAPTIQVESYADNAGQAASADAADGVLAKAIDNNGLGLTATLAQNGGPQHGTLVLNADGSFTYTPTLGFTGTDSFTYVASDSLSSGAPTTVTLNVAATAPTTQAASYADNAGQAASADAAHGVLANAIDNNGLGLTATLAQNGGPQHGTLVLNADGSFTYTPTLGFAGTDSFTYVASDSLSSSGPVTVTLNVAATAPTTQAASYADNAGQAASADAAHGVLAYAVDNNGLGLTATLTQNGGPQHGTLVLNADGSFTYTPTLGFAGTDSFTYVASDSLSVSGPVTVTLNVAATAPTTQAASYADNAGQAASADSAHGVLANAIDNNGLGLTATLAQNGGPQHGTLVLNADGSFTYTPTLGFTGTDSFTYVASDSLSSGAPTTVTLNVAATAPTTQAASYADNAGQAASADAAHGVLANAIDNNGLGLTATLAQNGGPQHGTLVLNADGSFTYTPTLGFAGTDSFSYVASDSLSSSGPVTVTLNIAATAPTTQAASYADNAGQAASADSAHGVLANAIDNNGLGLTATLTQNGGPQHGTLVLNADGSFTYTPSLGFAGTDSFTYVASDSLSSSGPVTVTLNVAATAPTTADAIYRVKAGSAFGATAIQGVLSNDSDQNGLALAATLTANGGPQHGALVLNPDGSFTFKPTLGFAGTDSFTYVASDSLSSSAPVTVTLDIAATAPTTQAASYSDNAGQAASPDAAHGVLANAVDYNGLGLTAALAQNGGPQHGTLVLNADGSFTYTPTLGFAGPDSFTYVASDSLSVSGPTTITLNVAATAPATAPAAYAPKAGSVFGATAAQGVLSKDSDQNGLTLAAALAANGGPAHGVLVLNADGSFTYTPTLGYAGADSFTYVASDSLSSSSPIAVTLNVAASAPTTAAITYAAGAGALLTETAALGVLSKDSDNNGLTLTAALAANGGPAHGTLALNANGAFTYTPNLGFAGTDSFTYVASDSLSSSTPVTVTFNVAATAPTTATITYAAKAGTALSEITSLGVLSKDSDKNGLTLTAALAANGGPAHGTLALSANGAFTYSPNLGFAGTDSFTYIASDSLSSSAPITVTLNVAATAPTTAAAAYSLWAGHVLSTTTSQSVLTKDADQNGLTLTAALAAHGGPQHGILLLNADGSFTYTPTLGYAGTDSFTYIASDSLSSSNPVTVTLNVAATAPTTAAATYAAKAGSAFSATAALGVLSKDADHNGLTLTAALAPNGGPAHGVLALNADGSFTYTPTLGYAGTDSFTYIASDSLSSSSPITVTLNVAATAPTTATATYAAKAGAAFSATAALGVLSKDADHNGLALTAALATNGGPTHGVLALKADGSFTYTPTLGYAGTDSFTYIAADSLSSSSPVTVTLNVAATAPTTATATYAAKAGSAFSATAALGVLSKDADHNGLTLTAALATNGGPAHGVLALNADGSFTYTPTLGYAGTDSFTYVASDSLSSSAPTKVTVTVAATAPKTSATTYAAVGDITTKVNAALGVLSADTDNNGIAMTAALAANGAQLHGTLVLMADGSFSYTPTLGYVGADSFTYVASDSLSSSVSTKVTLTVAAQNITGGTGNDTYYVYNSADKITVAANTPNESVIAYSSYTLPANIQHLTLNGSGLTGSGNSLGDTLTSLGGANTLVAGSGAATFYVNNVGDKVINQSGQKGDIIVSSVSYAVPTGIHILELTTQGTTATGNAAGGNQLISLNGGDTLVGSAAGNDSFTVYHSGDAIQVASGTPGDSVNAWASFTLPANVAKIVGQGTAAITLVGNAMSDIITPNTAADTLTAGTGAATFVIAVADKLEVITNFTSSDQIDISAFQTAGLAPTFTDHGSYSTITFSDQDTIQLFGVHASDLSVHGHYVI